MIKFLICKHWQLFGVLIGLPLVIQTISLALVSSTNNPFIQLKILPFLLVVYSTLFGAWLYSAGTHLHKKLPESVRMSLIKFKICILIPTLYMLLISGYAASCFVAPSSVHEFNPALLFILLPLHLFSIFGIFYCLYFIAKAVKAAEWQRPVTFSDFAGEFLLFWLYPIGIWILQPRINKLFETPKTNSTL